MSRSTTHKAEFAGQDRLFRLRIGEMGELENLCGAGIGMIFQRLIAFQYKYVDVRETIRLGLIGGGMVPSQAASLVKRYVDAEDVPVTENAPLAIDILRVKFEGVTEATKGDDPPGERTGSGSPATSPLS